MHAISSYRGNRSEMTYTVSSGTLNSSIPYHTVTHTILAGDTTGQMGTSLAATVLVNRLYFLYRTFRLR